MQAVSFLRTGVDPRVKNPTPLASKPMGSKILGLHATKTSVKPSVIEIPVGHLYSSSLSKFKQTTSGKNITKKQ